MKKILGLDLGTNSIGWALIEINHENKIVNIRGLGCRILSMDAREVNTFETGGKLKSPAAQKTMDKTNRKLNERFLLRRDRLHCVLNLLKILPSHYKESIDFETEKGYRSGKFRKGVEEKLAYAKDTRGNFQFLFMDSYKEMEADFRRHNPSLFYKKQNGKETQIPFDWTLYYLRKKALTKEVSKEELAWIILSFNQKRGYTKTIGQDEKLRKEGEISEEFIGKVKSVTEIDSNNESKLYEVVLVDVDNVDKEIYSYIEESKKQITALDELKEVEQISKYDDNGNIDEKETIYTIKEIRELLVTEVKYAEKKGDYEIVLEPGWAKKQTLKYFPKWKDTVRAFIVKTNYDANGKRILKGADKGRNISAPKEEDWTLIKLKTETAISSFNAKNKTVGVASYIYNELLKKPNQKIKGDLVTVIERKYYRSELAAIFKCQMATGKHPQLEDKELYQKAIQLLYPNNESHRNTIKDLGFAQLITEDVILYQRDLKSKKSLIADCAYEKENFTKIDRKTGKAFQEPLKAIHKANPLYQEFRIWQFIKRLKIIQLETKENEEVFVNQDISKSILTKEAKENLFEYLNNKEFVTQPMLLKYLRLSEKEYKWNYDNEHKEPCNETRYNCILRLKRIKGFDWKRFLTSDTEYKIWHFFYSVKKQDEFKKGIYSLFEKLLTINQFSLDYKNELVKNFSAFGGYTNDYGTYSEKALKKLIPFLRIGKYWDAAVVENILKNTNHQVKEKVLTKEGINGEMSDFQGLWISSACYLVYHRYSEVGDLQYWHTPDDINNFLRNEFKQHSLNNPVVEKVLRETLQLVKDIWKHFGIKNSEGVYQKLFDKIHIELGREMKQNAKEREKETKRNSENKKTNERIIELLKDLRKENEAVRSKSQFQQEKLRILEDDLLSSIEYDKDATVYALKNTNIGISRKEIKDIIGKEISKISKSDFERYKLWLDQRYQSPYTGEFIKLSDLFNREKYEIEHIFPQERITLNASYNKVICETEVNKAKKALTGYQFILNSKGTRKIRCSAHNKEVPILDADAYAGLIKSNFTDKKKQEILLSKDIPEGFTNSQLNNARYISKMAMKLLSNLVREDGEDSFRSKNVLPVNGVITSKLKKDWQLNDAWNELIKPRFKRLNEITKSNLFGECEKINGHDVFINRMPHELNKTFDKKRIDHRHHAMDALVIALTTENHVNYLNNISSKDQKEDKFEPRIEIKNKITDTKSSDVGEKSRFFLPPAQEKKDSEIIKYQYIFKDTLSDVFKDVVLNSLQNTIVSFKQKTRVIKQRTNKYQKRNADTGKIEVAKEANLNRKENYNVRQALHTSMPYGKRTYDFDLFKIVDNLSKREQIIDINIKEQLNELFGQFGNKVGLIQSHLKENPILDADKKPILVTAFKIETEKFRKRQPIAKLSERGQGGINSNEDAVKFINKVGDFQLQQDLLLHLKNNGNDIDIAFGPDGVNEFNSKRIKPVNRLPISEKGEKRFALGDSNYTRHKWVESEAGANLFCGFYANKDGKRKFEVPTLKETIENLKQGNDPCKTKIFDEKMLEEYNLLFVLSPNDLVYVPTDAEIENSSLVDYQKLSTEQISRIYKFTDGNSDNVMNFVPYYISKTLIDLKKDKYKALGLKELIFEEKGESRRGITTKEKELVNEVGLGSTQSKNQNSFDDIQIKSLCWKLEVDRLGNIK